MLLWHPPFELTKAVGPPLTLIHTTSIIISIYQQNIESVPSDAHHNTTQRLFLTHVSHIYMYVIYYRYYQSWNTPFYQWTGERERERIVNYALNIDPLLVVDLIITMTWAMNLTIRAIRSFLVILGLAIVLTYGAKLGSYLLVKKERIAEDKYGNSTHPIRKDIILCAVVEHIRSFAWSF